jgi:GTP-binding protein
VQSAQDHAQLPPSPAEVTFVGRSNVGKSSVINALSGRKKLAHVSNTPGRTRLLNLFEIDAGKNTGSNQLGPTMVDLPGYGYAAAPGQMRGDWQRMIEGYLLERESLEMIVVLVDGVVGPTKLDIGMLDWLRASDLPHTVVATKHDKVKSSLRNKRKREVAEKCNLEPGDIVWVSAVKGTGIDRLRSLVRSWLA